MTQDNFAASSGAWKKEAVQRAVVDALTNGDKVVVTFAVCAGVPQIELLAALEQEKMIGEISPLHNFQTSDAKHGWSCAQNRKYVFQVQAKFTHRRFWELYSANHFDSIEIEA